MTRLQKFYKRGDIIFCTIWDKTKGAKNEFWQVTMVTDKHMEVAPIYKDTIYDADGNEVGEVPAKNKFKSGKRWVREWDGAHGIVWVTSEINGVKWNGRTCAVSEW